MNDEKENERKREGGGGLKTRKKDKREGFGSFLYGVRLTPFCYHPWLRLVCSGRQPDGWPVGGYFVVILSQGREGE
jgi:hypothetical protein